MGHRQQRRRRRGPARNWSCPRTKPAKNTEASSSSSDSWTAWRSESETRGDQQPEPERGQHERRDHADQERPAPSIGTPKPTTSSANVRPAIAARGARTRAPCRRELAGEIGETRNSSMRPVVRSRTSDSAMSVTAMCWRTSASTAGPKNATTSGSIGATLIDLGLGRRGDHLGRDLRPRRRRSLSAYVWPSLGDLLDDDPVDLALERRGRGTSRSSGSTGSITLTRTSIVDCLPPRTAARGRPARRATTSTSPVRRRCSAADASSVVTSTTSRPAPRDLLVRPASVGRPDSGGTTMTVSSGRR